MKQHKDKAAVIKGVLYPSDDHIKAVVASLRRRVKADPKLAKQLRKDPRRSLAAFGLNEDVQRELLRDMGVKTKAGLDFCVCTHCCFTCYCTQCCTTEMMTWIIH